MILEWLSARSNSEVVGVPRSIYRLHEAVRAVLSGTQPVVGDENVVKRIDLLFEFLLQTTVLIAPGVLFAFLLTLSQDQGAATVPAVQPTPHPTITRQVEATAVHSAENVSIPPNPTVQPPVELNSYSWETQTISMVAESVAITSTVTVSELQANYTKYRVDPETQLFLDTEGIPVAISMYSADSNTESYTRYLTYQEIGAFKNAHQAAIDMKEPWVVDLEILNPFMTQTLWDYTDGSNNKETTEVDGVAVPESVDVLTTEALASFRVAIHTPDNFPSQLYIRPSAFEKKGFLQPLRILNEIQAPDEQFSLDIFVVDSTFLHSSQLTKEQRALLTEAEIKELNLNTEYIAVTNFRNEQNKTYNRKIDAASSELYKLYKLREIPQQATSQLESDIREKCAELLRIRKERNLFNTVTDAELYYYFYDEIVKLELNKDISLRRAIGQFINIADSKRSMIFLTAGEATIQKKAITQFWYTADGQLQGQVAYPSDLGNASVAPRLLPKRSKSFPNPARLIYNPTASRNNGKGDYFLGSETIIQILQHEISHLNLIVVLPEISTFDSMNDTEYMEKLKWFTDLLAFIPGIPKEFTFDPSKGILPNHNEFDTDAQTYNLLLEALDELLINKQHGLYQFVLTIPATRNNPQREFMIADKVKEFVYALQGLHKIYKKTSG